MQLAEVVTIEVRALKSDSVVVGVGINLHDFGSTSGDIAGRILTLKSNLSCKVLTSIFSVDLARVASEHGAFPVALFLVAIELD